jgi:putative Holliday junction resolvase
MKILALDLGDRWVGIAISDGLHITCRPLQTVELPQLDAFLADLLMREEITLVLVGHPVTLSESGKSTQTVKVEEKKAELEQRFGNVAGREITWRLWDERSTSQQADELKRGKPKDKNAKLKQHSVAASFILKSYLDSIATDFL